MNLFKKATASVALVALVSGVFSTGVSAYNAADLAAAESLATAGVINTQATAGGYNLDSTITRGEIAKVAANVADITPFTTCEGKFSDVSATVPNTWVCGYVEALLAAGKVSANAEYNSERNLSKAEALKLMLEAAGHTDIYTNGATWQEEVVAYAVSNDVLASSFSDYNTSALRGWVFNVADTAMNTEDEIDLPGIIPGIDDIDTDETTDTTDPVVTPGDNELVVTLSANTPDSMDITRDAKGVNVLEFDVTAGSEDITVKGLELERTGFGSAAADQVAVFSNEGRVSKEKSFNSDDIANVSFSPAFVVKAGETKALKVRVNVANTGEFAVKLNKVNASSDVTLETIAGNTFDAKNTVAAVLEVKNDGVNSTVTSGETEADVAEFNLKNKGATGTSADVDLTVTSVTLKEVGSIDQEDFLSNLTLSAGGKTLSTVASMNGKYVTFAFDGVVIADGKNESFKVTADITGGAGDTIQFELDNVVDVEAKASRYNSVNVEMDTALTAASGTFDSITVQAGELTIYAIDAEKDKIRGDKDDVVLGQLKIVNVAGKNLELDNLKVNLNLSNVTSAPAVDTLAEVLENVEFEINGTSYDLNPGTGTTDVNGAADYSETDLDIVLPQGTSILTVRADTLKDLDNGTTLTMTLANAGTKTTGGLVVVETEDDENVGDISPSSLSWDALEVENASVTVSNVPLANVKVVKGAEGLVALQFEVEAGEASSVTLDKLKVLVKADAANATKDQISEVALYKGSVSDANVLDRVSGSKLASGVATFDGFELKIDADQTQTFIVTINTVDTTDVVGKVIVASMDQADISLEDDENTTITLTSNVISDKEITVQGSGKLTISSDANNTDNKDVKTILAGEESVVYSADVLATNEKVNVETVKFTLNKELKKVVKNAKLYLGDVVVATASNSDVVDSNSTPYEAPVTAVKASVESDSFVATDGTVTDATLNIDGVSITVTANQTAAQVAAIVAGTTFTNVDAVVTNTDKVTFTAKTAGVAANGALTASDLAYTSTGGATTTISALTLAGGVDAKAEVASVGTSVITFDNISKLDVDTSTEELRLAIVTETIGFEKIGTEIAGGLVTKVEMDDAKGVDSNENVTVNALTSTSAKAFAVVPVKLTASVVATLANGTAKIKLTADAGNNTQANANSAPVVTLNSLAFVSNGTADSFKIYEDGEAAPAAFASGSTAGASASVTSITFTDSVVVNVLAEGVKDQTYALELNKDGITYNTSSKVNMSTTLSLGTKTY